MKTTLLLFTALIMNATVIQATNTKIDVNRPSRYAQPIVFVERGIEFLVFPDGSFDFNTNYEDTYYNSRRNAINASYHGPRVSISYSSVRPNRTYISRDRNGVIRSIGDVYLNYNRNGQVTRIGSIFIDYGRGRNATLTRVGGLRVNYNRWGEIVNVKGRVNGYDDYCQVCGIYGCTMDHSHDDHHHDNHDNNRYDDWRNDDGYYYFKQNGEVKKHKKNRH